MKLSSKSRRRHKPEPQANSAEARFTAIGTTWNIQLLEPMERGAWAALIEVIKQRAETFDKAYSRFRNDSLVAEIAKTGGTYELPPDGYELLSFYDQLYQATAGKVTPLIGQAMADAGYDADYSFRQKSPKQPPAWETALSYDQRYITASQPILLDFGAAGKGYLVDIIGELIERAGARSYLINAGGDIRHRSASSDTIQVGLENPLDTSEAIGIVRLRNRSLCASAGSKRQWGDFHHIIDPDLLRSPRRVLASWVIADDTMTADGLATALFFTEPKALLKHFTFSYAVLYEGMDLRHDPDFPVKLFTAAEHHESNR